MIVRESQGGRLAGGDFRLRKYNPYPLTERKQLAHPINRGFEKTKCSKNLLIVKKGLKNTSFFRLGVGRDHLFFYYILINNSATNLGGVTATNLGG